MYSYYTAILSLKLVIACFFFTVEGRTSYTKLIIPVAARRISVRMLIKNDLKMRQILKSICENPGRDDGSLSEVIPLIDDFNLFEECIDVMGRIA